MKTFVKIAVLVILLMGLILTACSSPASTSQANGTAQPGSGSPGNAELTLPMSLAVGTLKLEETDQAVSAEQAAEMLDLWQAYQALSNSETTAAVELEAVIAQIQDAMTPEQLQAIEDMQLTRQSMTEVMQSLGIEFGPWGDTGAQGTPEAWQDFQEFRGGTAPEGDAPGSGVPGGRMPGGGMPGGDVIVPGDGQGFGAQVTPDASTQATMQARMSTQANRVSPMLLEALITMLETKAQNVK